MDNRHSRLFSSYDRMRLILSRLGKNTLEDVKGYVEAADIINVALVDLGDGATQTIAKLTDIFGVSEMMGTRDAMLGRCESLPCLVQFLILPSFCRKRR